MNGLLKTVTCPRAGRTLSSLAKWRAANSKQWMYVPYIGIVLGFGERMDFSLDEFYTYILSKIT